MQPNPLFLNLPALEQAIDRYPLMVGADTSVVDAISLLGQARGISCTYPSFKEWSSWSNWSQKQADCVLVVEGTQLVGMLTERDVVRLSAFGIDLSKMTVAQVMRQQVTTLAPSNEDVLSVLSLLHQHQIRHLPILMSQVN